MRIFLGGHLNFYHPKKEKWLEVELVNSTALAKLLKDGGVPLHEVQLVAINGEVVDLQDAVDSGSRSSEQDDRQEHVEPTHEASRGLSPAVAPILHRKSAEERH